MGNLIICMLYGAFNYGETCIFGGVGLGGELPNKGETFGVWGTFYLWGTSELCIKLSAYAYSFPISGESS